MLNRFSSWLAPTVKNSVPRQRATARIDSDTEVARNLAIAEEMAARAKIHEPKNVANRLLAGPLGLPQKGARSMNPFNG